ncbi:major paralogous domain-containing protein [Flavobacterium noncentrifugens]|uniref:Major paralogous domain-containing protein n=2 Tax=Flavobacterium noncentrifugens TaxID=1128970 RepID=A0A1G8RCD9_9FLAO|nr:major paralogous domain-containing protein [Flavobacterium noncentrifugens]
MLMVSCASEENLPTATVKLAVVVTSNVFDVKSDGAVVNANVSEESTAPVTNRGVCWSTATEPTVGSNAKSDGENGGGSFSETITGLVPNTNYYVRAFAENKAGVSYGNQIAFKTHLVTPPVTDIDGNVYETIQIGSQLWMKENLKTTRYCNGDEIPNVTGNNWFSLTSGAWRYYDNRSENNAVYGKLYNWYAATDARNVCPCDWHLPTREEWLALINHVGYNGGKLKSVTGWNGPNTGATNETGFTGLPGGFRGSSNLLFYFGTEGGWWKNHVNDEAFVLTSFSDGLGNVVLGKTTGASIRCIKN